MEKRVSRQLNEIDMTLTSKNLQGAQTGVRVRAMKPMLPKGLDD